MTDPTPAPKPSPTPRPTVGRDVHYVAFGSAPDASGHQKYQSVCRAAKITEVPDVPDIPLTVGLAVINPTGLFFDRSVPYDDGGDRYSRIGNRGQGESAPVLQRRSGPVLCNGRQYDGGSWHWPERV